MDAGIVNLRLLTGLTKLNVTMTAVTDAVAVARKFPPF
jgi:hypothetical protein